MRTIGGGFVGPSGLELLRTGRCESDQGFQMGGETPVFSKEGATIVDGDMRGRAVCLRPSLSSEHYQSVTFYEQ